MPRTPSRRILRRFSPAEATGATALASAAALAAACPLWALIPLGLFLTLCGTAPFVPRWGFFLPVISRGPRNSGSIALSFDDGPSPATTPLLLDLLERYSLPATFFVNGVKAERHPQLIDEIVRRGHTIGNHSWDHDYFLMLRSIETLHRDISATQRVLEKHGISPRYFRPPVGITGPRLAPVLAALDMTTVTYSRRALDRGNRHTANLADRILSRLRPGDIIMLHDLPVYHPEEEQGFQKKLNTLFAALAKNHKVVPLEELIGALPLQGVREKGGSNR